jgi:ribosome-associated protein
MEGVTGGRWALIDYVDVVVHIFLEHVRSFYDLEGLWAEAPTIEVKDKGAPELKKAPEPKAKAAVKKAVKKHEVTKAVKKTAVTRAPKKAAAPKAPKKTAAAKAPKKAAVTKAGKKKKSE